MPGTGKGKRASKITFQSNLQFNRIIPLGPGGVKFVGAEKGQAND